MNGGCQDREQLIRRFQFIFVPFSTKAAKLHLIQINQGCLPPMVTLNTEYQLNVLLILIKKKFVRKCQGNTSPCEFNHGKEHNLLRFLQFFSILKETKD